jgi:uncharacterized protein YhaN
MRIQRLDLIRYGHFTNLPPIEFPYSKQDFHIIYGPNEAGKSTALNAIEDFLFGIPANSPLNFLHENANLRIGASLKSKDQEMEARRRKGNKDTLLSSEEVPFPAGEITFAPFLAGTDRKFFTKMFSLTHDRLRQGGSDILKAQDDVGQMLFSAGTGILGMRERLKDLETEADGLWASRRAGHRKYYQASDRLQAADGALRTHLITASKWLELKRNFEAAGEKCLALEKDLGDRVAEVRKLSRVRRLFRSVHTKLDLDRKIAEHKDTLVLPERARKDLEDAREKSRGAESRAETLKEQYALALAELALMEFDSELLLREEDVRELNEKRSSVRAGKSDLPTRRQELAVAEGNLKRLAVELEWESLSIAEITARIPSRPKLAAVRALLNNRGGLFAIVATAKKSLHESELTLEGKRDELRKTSAVVDVSKLAAMIKVAREASDVGTRIREAELEIGKSQKEIQLLINSLDPIVSDESVLAIMSLPPWESVQIHRDGSRNLDQRIRDNKERIRIADSELTKHQKAYNRITKDEQAVSFEELDRVRKHREVGWSILRRRYVENTSIPDEEVQSYTGLNGGLSEVYESAVQSADQTADRRFEKAAAAAELVVISRLISGQREMLEFLDREMSALSQEDERLKRDWIEMWRNLPFSPLSHDAMMDWITTRKKVLELVDRRTNAENLIRSLAATESNAKDGLLAELQVLGEVTEKWKNQNLKVVCEGASSFQKLCEKNTELISKLDIEIQKAQLDFDRRLTELDKGLGACTDWERNWAKAIESFGMGVGIEPEVAESRINAIDEMREILVKVDELRKERIAKIEQFISDFGSETTMLVSSIASDLIGLDPEAAVLELGRRVETAKRIRDILNVKTESAAALKKAIDDSDEAWRAATRVIRQLQETASATDIPTLLGAIEKSESLRALRIDLAKVEILLAGDGDGIPLSQIQMECTGIDLDQVVAREGALTTEIKELQDKQLDARDKWTKARQEFEAIGGDDVTARDAADRQAALAEMKDAAERYLKARTAALVLQWAVDRFRQEKQGPLLKLAGSIFSALTRGSFANLKLDFDDQDNPQLAGVRPSGAKVSVSGMSTGTRDQLFLALRLASIHDYFGHAKPLPFVADDLFINFDDLRAESGFEALGQLAGKTQVLFFTHHKHHVDIARRALGANIIVHDLSQVLEVEGRTKSAPFLERTRF